MINLNDRAKMMKIARASINSKVKLSEKEKNHILLELLKKLIKYKANVN